MPLFTDTPLRCPECGSKTVDHDPGDNYKEYACQTVIYEGELTQGTHCDMLVQLLKEQNNAAGPWQDGEPPKDGVWIAWSKVYPDIFMLVWWSNRYGSWVEKGQIPLSVPIHKHCKINLPSAE